MVKKRLFIVLLICVLLSGVLPVCADDNTAPAACLFYENFEGYPAYGNELFSMRWDVVSQHAETGSTVLLEQDDNNGFAAFQVKTGIRENRVSTPVVSIRKDKIDQSKKTLVYEGLFYAFDENAKLALSFSDARGNNEVELVTLRGSELCVRNADNLVEKTAAEAERKQWNKISVVFNEPASKLTAYLNGEVIAEERRIDIKGLQTNRISFKISVKNNTGIPYAQGRIYMDNFCIYKSTEPKDREDISSAPGEITTLLNKQFTSIARNGRAPGIASFDSTVTIVDAPSELNKSAAIILGKDGDYIPKDQVAIDDFNAKIFCCANDAVSIFVKNTTGQKQKLFDLEKYTSFQTAEIQFDFERAKCILLYQGKRQKETDFSLDNVAYIGFEGREKKIVLNKVLAYSGAENVDESFFKDYSYQQKAIDTLVNPEWKKAYKTISNGVFLSVDFYQASVFGKNLRYHSQPPRMFDGIPYVPVAETTVFLGGEILEEPENGEIRILADGRTAVFGKEEVVTSNHIAYVPAQALAAAFGLRLSWDGSYLLGFGKNLLFTGTTEENEELKSAVYFQRPSGEEIFDRVEKKGSLHPRVLVNSQRLVEVKNNIKNDPVCKTLYEKLKQEADENLNAYTLYYTKPDGTRLLSVSNLMVSRMETLGIAYKVTGDQRYAQAAWRDLFAVSKFEDWNPSHYLDVGTMSLGVAIGYSWFYDYLTDEQKDIIVEGFVRCGLGSYLDSIDRSVFWLEAESNWNPWCHGGILNAIVAMSDRLGDSAKYALDKLFVYTEALYPGFVPDGAWAEGTSYHAVTLRHLSQWCETLEIATGKDYGYWDLPGMDRTAYYGDALSGAGGVFNYGDNTETRSNYAGQAWFAKKFKDSGLAQLRYNNLQENAFAPTLYDLIMTRPEMLGGTSDMAPDILYKNMNLVSMRTSWANNTEGFFLAAKGGENGASHFHYDLGGFVMDVGGTRFAYELGRESYATTAGDTETKQYKKRAEGHNTFVINPDERPGQANPATAQVVAFETKPRGGYAVIDLAPAYSGARNMKRGFFLTNDRQTMLIQDEITLASSAELYWFMHTRGDIRFENEGKTAYITFNSVTIRMDILESDNAGAVFEERAALPLPTTPWLEGQGKNTNYKKLTVHWPEAQKFTLAIAVSQVLDETLEPYRPEVVPMEQWTIPDGELSARPQLTAITKDGETMQTFTADKYSYVVNLPYDAAEKPVYGYYADDSVEVDVIESEKISGVTKFIVKSKERSMYSVYTVTTKIDSYSGAIPGTREAEIVQGTASEEPEYEAGHRAVNVLDGDYNTRWTAEGDQWITLELKEAAEVYAVGVAWNSGDSRTYLFDIEASEDGENWTEVLNGVTSSSKSNEIESFLLGNTKAKYIRYQGHGHVAGSWNGLSEMRVYTK